MRKYGIPLVFLFVVLNALLALSAFKLGRFSDQEIIDAIAMSPSPNSLPILISVLALLISVANFIYTIRLNKEKSENECAKARADLLNKMSVLLDSYQTYIRHEREIITDARTRNLEHVEMLQETLESAKKDYDKLFDEYIEMRVQRKSPSLSALLMEQHEIETKQNHINGRIEYVSRQVDEIYERKRVHEAAIRERVSKVLGEAGQ